MSQSRDAPAYQEYAASMMAQIAYRTMTLQERGLFYSMRLECWVNGKLSENPGLLAKVLGFSEKEVSDSLPAVMRFFVVSDGFVFCPELEDYRKHLEMKKEKARQHGRAGAAITNGKRKPSKKRMDTSNNSVPSGTPSPILSGSSQSPCQGEAGVLVKLSTAKPSQEQPLIKEVDPDPWLAEYEAELKKVKVTV